MHAPICWQPRCGVKPMRCNAKAFYLGLLSCPLAQLLKRWLLTSSRALQKVAEMPWTVVCTRPASPLASTCKHSYRHLHYFHASLLGTPAHSTAYPMILTQPFPEHFAFNLRVSQPSLTTPSHTLQCQAKARHPSHPHLPQSYLQRRHTKAEHCYRGSSRGVTTCGQQDTTTRFVQKGYLGTPGQGSKRQHPGCSQWCEGKGW